MRYWFEVGWHYCLCCCCFVLTLTRGWLGEQSCSNTPVDRVGTALRVAKGERSRVSGRKSDRTNKQSRKYFQAGKILN